MNTVSFDEASKLFTKHAEVVRAIEGAFKACLNKFWDQIFKEITDQADELEFTWSGKNLWLAEKGTKGNPYLHTDWYDPAIISEGELVLTAALDKATPQEIAALSSLKQAPGYRKSKGTKYYLFDIVVPCLEGAPADQIAHPIVETLQLMRTKLASLRT